MNFPFVFIALYGTFPSDIGISMENYGNGIIITPNWQKAIWRLHLFKISQL